MKKPSLLIAIGGKPKPDEEDDDYEEESSEHDDAAQMVLDAVKENDASALSEALRAFYLLCKNEED